MPSVSYNGNSGVLALTTTRGVEVAVNQGAATILREDSASTISDSGRNVSLANAYSHAVSMGRETSPSSRRRGESCCRNYRPAKPGCLSRTDEPAAISLWIAEHTSRSSLGQKQKIPEGCCQDSRELLKGVKKKDYRKVHWTEDTRRSFEKCKTDLAKAALLSFPRSGLSLSLCTDFAVGSVQFENEDWKPIAFYLKKLNDTQRYSTYDRELLGIYLSLKHFKHLLEGNDFTFYTDHKHLTFAFQQKNEKASPRQLRQLQYISKFLTNIQHVQGNDNVVADALSKIESVSTIDYDAIAEKQQHDKELQKLIQGSSSLQFKPSTLPSGKTIWCDISILKIRPYIPEEFRMQMFQQIHGFCLLGVRSTIK
ncbi:integrase catalytic domain-containing protein [Trichonephila clavipes]|nr:integrase catalytic domain-containing protein [Trichonephila clavipes]